MQMNMQMGISESGCLACKAELKQRTNLDFKMGHTSDSDLGPNQGQDL